MEEQETTTAKSRDVEKGINERQDEDIPYSILTKNQKWFIVVFIAFAGLFR
jgi:hypothetical protein